MSGALLIAGCLIAPCIAVLAGPLLRAHPNRREAASLACAALLIAFVLPLSLVVMDGQRPTLTLLEFLPGVSLRFEAEPLGVAFALIVSLLWPVTILYAIGYMRAHGEANQTRFYLFFALAIVTTIGGALAGNLLTLYLFYEALTLATYPLVTHGGGRKDRAAGRIYLAILLGTSFVFLLLAIAWVYLTTGTLEFVNGGLLLENGQLRGQLTPGLVAVLYALFLFGTAKAALMPFHGWLPAAMVAPTPVSALLHAVAVVKLGVFAILKVTVYTFGIDTLLELEATTFMQGVAAFSLLAAAVLALREDSLKRRLAYSTISQLAYVVLAATLANTSSLLAGGIHIAAHAFAKITLFFCAGVILISLHKTAVSELGGSGRALPITWTAWIIASLCVIGLPFTGGFWSKWYLVQGTLDAERPFLLAVVLLGSLLAMGYLLPPAIRAFFGPGPADARAASAGQTVKAPWTSLAALSFTAVLTVLLFFVAQPMVGLLQGISVR